MDQQTTSVEDTPRLGATLRLLRHPRPAVLVGGGAPRLPGAARIERFRIGSNIVAFLFGGMYFFAKGMWRKGLTMVVVTLAVQGVAALLDAPGQLQYLLGYAVGGVAMTTANYAYYLHVTEDSTSWNPFEGLGRR